MESRLARQQAVEAVHDVRYRGENLTPLSLAEAFEHMVDDPTLNLIPNGRTNQTDVRTDQRCVGGGELAVGGTPAMWLAHCVGQCCAGVSHERHWILGA